MPTYVTRPDEIAINAVKYHVVGGVTLSLASVYPLKQVTGDYNEDTQPYVSIHTWDDWRGGIGVDRWKGPEDDNRSWISTCWTRNRNHLLLPPLWTLTADSGSSGVVNAAATLGTVLYAFFNSSPGAIRSLSSATGSWSASLASPDTSTDALTLNINGTETLVFAATTAYLYSTNGSSWTTRTKNVIFVCQWDGRLWGLDSTGQLWYTFTPGSNEVNDAILPMINGAVIGNDGTRSGSLFVAPDAAGEPIIYALTKEGLYAHDAANSRFIRVNFSVPSAGATWTSYVSAVHEGIDIFILAGKSVLRYAPIAGTVEHIAPNSLDGLPALYEAAWLGSLASNGNIYISSGSQGNGTNNMVLEWNGKSWQVFYNDPTFNAIAMLWAAPIGTGSYLLSKHVTVNGKLGYINLFDVAGSPKQTSSWTYASSAIHKTPWYDAGQNDVNKLLLEVRVTTQDCDSNDTVKVEIAYDYAEGAADVSYTTLGTITSNGTTTYSMASGVGTAFVAARIKLTLSGGASTTSPDVSRVSLVYLKSLPPKYMIEAKLLLQDIQGGITARAQRAALVTAMESSTLVEVTHRNDSGGTRNWNMKIVQARGLEKTGEAEDGMVDIVAVEI